jgi:large subunit ribosomal protein L18Ae
MHQYEVVGRAKPTATKPNPGVFRMQIFARNAVAARSRFWYFMSNLQRVKRSNGEILSTREIFEKNPNVVKGYGIQIRYDSRSGTHNMYKEFRDTTLCGAITKLYADLSGRHRVRSSSIQIISTCVLTHKNSTGDNDTTYAQRTNTRQFMNSNIKIPAAHRVNKPSSRAYKSTFKAVRPTSFF